MAESDNQDALSEAVKGRATISGFAPIDTLKEPRTDENPFPITLSMTDPVKGGLMDETTAGDNASYDHVEEVEILKKAEVTSKADDCLDPEEALQFAAESEIDDSHEDPENEMDCVTDMTPKRKPMTDKDVEPVLAALQAKSCELTAGSAYDKDNDELLR